MKLYPEEQLRNSMLSMKTYIEKYDESVIDKIIENHIKALGGVELPSDEEIEQHAEENTAESNGTLEFERGFKRGAKWMRDKIQGGNK
jgi:hypothetical protein